MGGIIPLIQRYIGLEKRLIDGIFDLKLGCICNIPLINHKKWLSRRYEDEIAEFLRIKMEQNKQNILLDEFSLLSGC